MNLRVSMALAVSLAAPVAGQTSDYGSIGKFEINPFGGASLYGSAISPGRVNFVDGGQFGIRVTQNYWNFVSIEEVFRAGTNNARLVLPGGATTAFGNRVAAFGLGPVIHFTPRESRIRPFVKFGFSANRFSPTDNARGFASAASNVFGQPVQLESAWKAGLDYGVGLKARLHPRVAWRFDYGGLINGRPDFNIRSIGPANAAVPVERGAMNTAHLTTGLAFALGSLSSEPPGSWSVGPIEPSSVTAYEGDPVSFRVPVSNSFEGVSPRWSWSVDGAKEAATGDALSIRAGKPGSHPVQAVVEADQSGVKRGSIRRYLRKFPIAGATRNATVVVRDWPKPSVTVTSSNANITAPTPAPGATAPVDMSRTGSSTVSARAGAFERPRDLTYIFRASEGRLAPGETAGGEVTQPDPRTVIVTLKNVPPGQTPNVTVVFTPDGISIPPGGSREVPVTVTVKDSRGTEDTASTTIRLAVPAAPPLPPPPPPPPPPALEPIQLDDILFSQGRTRVNNCGKRVLDQAYERAVANGDYEVVLVGHIDERESRVRRPRRAKPLDQERVLNAAAYLTAGTGLCKRLEASRIKVSSIGTTQTSPFKTLLCAGSTDERAADRIRARDTRAQNRRVEVWLVPRPGRGRTPQGLNAQSLNPADLPKGCPK